MAITPGFAEFNINDLVRVKLTDHGRKLHRQHFEEFWAELRPVPPLDYPPPREDADGWSTWQLWALMQEFGNDVRITAEPVFETTIQIKLA